MNGNIVNLDNLARSVLEVEPNIKDYQEASVILETIGFSDDYARMHGYSNLFHLAEALMDVIDKYRVSSRIRHKIEKDWDILGGFFYQISWVIMMAFIFVGGLALWSSIYLSGILATSVSIGVILGFIVTGGVQQFFSYKMIYYRLQNNLPLSRYILSSAYKIGLVTVAAVGLAILYLGFSIPGLEVALVPLLFYFILISGWRLMMIPILAYRKALVLLITLAAALLVMYAGFLFFNSIGLDIITSTMASQLIGIATAIIAAGIYSVRLLSYKNSVRNGKNGKEVPPFYYRADPPKHVSPPRLSVLLYGGIPYILYGTAYYVFLFIDRIISWTAGSMFIFNTEYHIGVDLAILSIIPVVGVTFIYIARLSAILEEKLRQVDSVDKTAIPSLLKHFYLRMMVVIIITILSASTVMLLLENTLITAAGGTNVSSIVYRWGLLSYAFFSIFAANSVLAFALRRGKTTGILLLIGIFINLGLSIYLVNMFERWYAVFGLLVSSVLIASASIIYIYTLIRKSDYVYYSAF